MPLKSPHFVLNLRSKPGKSLYFPGLRSPEKTPIVNSTVAKRCFFYCSALQLAPRAREKEVARKFLAFRRLKTELVGYSFMNNLLIQLPRPPTLAAWSSEASCGFTVASRADASASDLRHTYQPLAFSARSVSLKPRRENALRMCAVIRSRICRRVKLSVSSRPLVWQSQGENYRFFHAPIVSNNACILDMQRSYVLQQKTSPEPKDPGEETMSSCPWDGLLKAVPTGAGRRRSSRST